jgi:hypothetical protein
MHAGLTDRQMARLLKEFGMSENESSQLHVVMLDRIKFDGDTSEVPARSWFLADQSKRPTGGCGTENRIFRQYSRGFSLAIKSRFHSRLLGSC